MKKILLISIMLILAPALVRLAGNEPATDPAKEKCVDEVCCKAFLKCYEGCGKTGVCGKECNDKMDKCKRDKCGVKAGEEQRYGCG
jgi:hypothetical protein